MKKQADLVAIGTSKDLQEYRPVSLCPDFAIIEFKGIFQGNEVLWHTEIRTLAYHCRLLSIGGKIRQFIDIPMDKVRFDLATANLVLGLNLDKINQAAIRSSIILIRQYKNLKPGVHQYGELTHFN